jgi:pSer/pThr/pTyr-binding forkhead associated (FHA) protein
MAKSTQALKTSMTILAGGNVPAYTLEYLSPAKNKKVGNFETIVVPYIELGRSNSCAVQFGEDNPTVSRKHAAIERRENIYFLIQLSSTNPSLINGISIAREGQLNNGDEIQLSMEGPKLRFNVTPTGTSSLGFTKKMNLVISQASKPYRRALYSLAVIFILVCLTGAWFIYSQQKQLKIIQTANDELKIKRQQDSLAFLQEINKNARLFNDLKRDRKKYLDETNRLNTQIKILSEVPKYKDTEIYQAVKDNIYFLQVEEIRVTQPDRSYGNINKKWMGTAFLCDDGKLITSRHCIQAWRFSGNDTLNQINLCENNKGELFIKYRAISNKDTIEFRFEDVVLNGKDDITLQYEMDNRPTGYIIKRAPSHNLSSDWAYVKTDNKNVSQISYDKNLSTNLNAGEKLYIFGYSLALGGRSEAKPLFSESRVAQSGVNSAGIITITDRNYEPGSSGGPVLMISNDSIKCIGIISFSMIYGGDNTSIGGIVPIANIK